MDNQLPQRIAYLRDSGILTEWISIQERNSTYYSSFQPHSLNLKGNVVVQFYCLGVGLAISCIAFFIEIRKAAAHLGRTLFKYVTEIALHNTKFFHKVISSKVNLIWSHFRKVASTSPSLFYFIVTKNGFIRSSQTHCNPNEDRSHDQTEHDGYHHP